MNIRGIVITLDFTRDHFLQEISFFQISDILLASLLQHVMLLPVFGFVGNTTFVFCSAEIRAQKVGVGSMHEAPQKY